MKQIDEKGITLVEVLVSVVLLMLVLTIFMQFLPQMAMTNQKNVEKNQAVNLAKEELFYWQNELNDESELEIFKNTAHATTCQLEDEEVTCYEYEGKIQHADYDENFDVSIKLWEKSELKRDLSDNPLELYDA